MGNNIYILLRSQADDKACVLPELAHKDLPRQVFFVTSVLFLSSWGLHWRNIRVFHDVYGRCLDISKRGQEKKMVVRDSPLEI